MLFYRLAVQRVIEYFKLDQLFKEDEARLILLHKKPKPVYKTILKTNQTWNFYVSVLLSLIGVLISISIPFAILESPSEIFLEREYHVLYKIARLIEGHLIVLDIFIILLIIALIVVSTITVMDAINNTDISISPWVERGKYYLKEKDAPQRPLTPYEYAHMNAFHKYRPRPRYEKTYTPY